MIAQSGPTAVQAIFWKQLTRAERRQLGNVSNAEATGGGARDLRCRPLEALQEVLGRQILRREARSVVYAATVRFVDDKGQDSIYELEYSVNDADASRANEPRIRRAGYFPPWMPAAIDERPSVRALGQEEAEDFGGDKIADYVVYLVKQADGKIYGGLLTKEQILNEDLHPQIREAIKSGRQGGRTLS